MTRINKVSLVYNRSMSKQDKYLASDHLPFYRLIQSDRASRFYLIPEITLLIVAVVSYLVLPYNLQEVGGWIQLTLWVYISGLLISLAVTNMKSGLLPNNILKVLFGTVATYVLVSAVITSQSQTLLSAVGGASILGLVPYIIYQISQGRWIGGGDVRIGAIVGLLLGWQLALVALALHILLTFFSFLIVGISQHTQEKTIKRIPSGFIWTLTTFSVFIAGNTLIR